MYNYNYDHNAVLSATLSAVFNGLPPVPETHNNTVFYETEKGVNLHHWRVTAANTGNYIGVWVYAPRLRDGHSTFSLEASWGPYSPRPELSLFMGGEIWTFKVEVNDGATPEEKAVAMVDKIREVYERI